MDERGLSEVSTVLPPDDPPSGGSTKEKVKEQAASAADSARQVAATTSDEARQVAGTAAEGAREVAKETGRQVSEVAGEAAAQAREMLAQTTGQLKEQASAQTGRAADGLRTVTSQLQALSTGRPEEAGAVGDYARQMTTKLEEVAGRLDDRGFDGIVDDVHRFARRRPGVFLLGAATAGFFAGRFLRGTQVAQSSEPTTPAAPHRQAPVTGTVGLMADVPNGTDGGRATGAL